MKSKVFEVILIIAFVLIISPFSTSAEIYKWTDDEGVIHATDDPSNVPAKYWEKEKVKKEEVEPATSPEVQPVQPGQPGPAMETEKKELYGDYPLDWWTEKFKGLRKEIADNEDKRERAKSFITLIEGGRRYGQIFTKEEVSNYENYKKEIPVLEEKIKNLKDELEELQRKARLYGVPRNIRE